MPGRTDKAKWAKGTSAELYDKGERYISLKPSPTLPLRQREQGVKEKIEYKVQRVHGHRNRASEPILMRKLDSGKAKE